MPLQKRAIDTATTEEKTSLYTHTCIILTTHCQHPLSLESFTLGKTQCNTTTLDRPCAHHLLQGEHHRYQHLLQDCRVHLHLLQQQDGAVFERRWRNSIDTVYTIGLYYFIQPWIRTCFKLISARGATAVILFYLPEINHFGQNHSTSSFMFLPWFFPSCCKQSCRVTRTHGPSPSILRGGQRWKR